MSGTDLSNTDISGVGAEDQTVTSRAANTDSTSDRQLVWLQHNKVRLALHQLKTGKGVPLLVLHGLGEPTLQPIAPWDTWNGPIWGLDFTGHGLSDVPRGGGYTAEILMSDVDVALSHIGPATIYGRGLGAYVALLVSGARPELVRGVVLTDGSGLTGGGEGPQSSTWYLPADADGRAPDPYILYELSNDVRPSDYAANFLHLLLSASELEVPLVVVAKNRPPWLSAIASDPGVVCETQAEAFTRYNEQG